MWQISDLERQHNVRMRSKGLKNDRSFGSTRTYKSNHSPSRVEVNTFTKILNAQVVPNWSAPGYWSKISQYCWFFNAILWRRTSGVLRRGVWIVYIVYIVHSTFKRLIYSVSQLLKMKVLCEGFIRETPAFFRSSDVNYFRRWKKSR